MSRFAVLMCTILLSGCATTDFPPSNHYVDGQFRNVGAFTEPTATRKDWVRHARRMLLGGFPEADDLPDGHVLPEEQVEAGMARAEGAELAVTWLGHATTLIRMGDHWIMTDPVLREHVGAGPFRLKRHQPARPRLADLPAIDAIVISHADHDHLDLPSMRQLARRNPDATVYVPLGVGPLVRRTGFGRVVELDWYQKARDGALTVEAVPAIHGTRRPPRRKDSMLWAGWVLRGYGKGVYYSGDTGFGSVLAETAARSAPVDVALVPIGAWSPRWFQEPFHVDPEEAAQLAQLMDAETAIGVHWGTFAMSEEAPTEQKRRFLAAETGGVEIIVPRVGETVILSGDTPS